MISHTEAQMPRRTRSHELEDLSRNRLHTLFESVGWTVEDVAKDYGEDLVVKIFERGAATPLKFFVQSKATDNSARLLNKRNNSFQCEVKIEHANHWNRFHEPVILTLWDSQSDSIYWACIQDVWEAIRGKSDPLDRKTTRIPISLNNHLDSEGIRQIEAITKIRFKRLIRAAQTNEALIDYFENKFNIKVECSLEHGIIIAKGASDGADVILSGHILAQLQDVATKRNISIEETLGVAIESFYRDSEEHSVSGEFPIFNRLTGKVEKTRMTTQQIKRHLQEVLDRDNARAEEKLDHMDRPV